MWAASFQVRSSNRNRSHSENSNKYMITCQDRITIESPTTNEWLSIIGPLKKTNQRDLNRVLTGILERRKAVAIKTSASQLLAKEYAIASMLKDIPGFMQPYCFFQCDDDYKEHPSKERSALIVMPYLEGGSMREFNWASNPAALHSCLMQFFCSLMQAYEMKGVIHNDTHFDNVLLKKTTEKEVEYILGGKQILIPTNGYLIVIMDFELSFNEVATNRGRAIGHLYDDILHGVNDLHYESPVDILNDAPLISALINLKTHPVPAYDGYITMKPLIENISVAPKQVRSFIYDPSAFD
jgi:hypothetical protein